MCVCVWVGKCERECTDVLCVPRAWVEESKSAWQKVGHLIPANKVRIRAQPTVGLPHLALATVADGCDADDCSECSDTDTETDTEPEVGSVLPAIDPKPKRAKLREREGERDHLQPEARAKRRLVPAPQPPVGVAPSLALLRLAGDNMSNISTCDCGDGCQVHAFLCAVAQNPPDSLELLRDDRLRARFTGSILSHVAYDSSAAEARTALTLLAPVFVMADAAIRANLMRMFSGLSSANFHRADAMDALSLVFLFIAAMPGGKAALCKSRDAAIDVLRRCATHDTNLGKEARKLMEDIAAASRSRGTETA